MRLFSRSLILAFAGVALVIACGSRTGLLVPTATDAGPLYEGVRSTSAIDCPTPAYCDPGDLGYVYECGVRVFQCSSLEQCEERENGDARAPSASTRASTRSATTRPTAASSTPSRWTRRRRSMGVCYAVFVVNQWKTGEPAKIEVTWAGRCFPSTSFARIPVGKGPA